MYFTPSDDQAFLRDTTARFLAEHAPPAELRRLRSDPDGFDREWWRRGADLGWLSLLVAPEHGGGSISGHDLVDLSLLAHEFGARAAPGPLASANVVAATLSATGRRTDVLADLVAGTSIATWAVTEPPPGDGLGEVATTVRVAGHEVVVDGVKQPVESATVADHLLVTGRTGEGLTQVLVPTDARGVHITPLQSVDLTRRFARVELDAVRVPVDHLVGEVGGGALDVERQLHHALVITNAESVGAMTTAFDMTLEWAKDRFSFGRPLASYQEIKHRFADMATWLEAGRAISDAALAGVHAGAADAAELVSAATAFIGDYGAELAQDCVQLHGGIGLTFEHDLHFYVRRITLGRTLWGTPSDHRRRITDLAEARAREVAA